VNAADCFVGVLVPPNVEPMPPPTSRVIGRVALALEAEGVGIVFGSEVERGRLSGFRATTAGWISVRDVSVVAFYDRFPSQARAADFARIRAGLAGVPISNPWSFTDLCRDKVECQRFLERHGIPMPALATDPSLFPEALARFGHGFLKPRFGALGEGVRRVHPGDALPDRLPGLVPDMLEPAILQEAIPAPAGWAGVSVRVLAQREANGRWTLLEPVVRRSADDPVVNVARGAEAAAGSDVLEPATIESLGTRATEALAALATIPEGNRILEVGLDFVVDPHGVPHLIEVNGRPRGRLEVLATLDPARFASPHQEAVERPLRVLARSRFS
jgi:glutathione synthase/RimK-type ligase-like ATP-grasp enzyme